MTKTRLSIVVALIVAGLGAGCSGATVKALRDDKILTGEEWLKSSVGKTTGEDVYIYGGSDKNAAPATALPVNNFMWHAALDTLSFMPLASADPFGGVIITD